MPRVCANAGYTDDRRLRTLKASCLWFSWIRKHISLLVIVATATFARLKGHQVIVFQSRCNYFRQPLEAGNVGYKPDFPRMEQWFRECMSHLSRRPQSMHGRLVSFAVTVCHDDWIKNHFENSDIGKLPAKLHYKFKAFINDESIRVRDTRVGCIGLPFTFWKSMARN